MTDLSVAAVPSKLAREVVEAKHYLRRKPPVSFAFGLFDGSELVGVCTFGVPASRHLQQSAAPSEPSAVIELNRLWVDDAMPRNTESWFVSRCLAMLPARIVVSYADTAEGHVGHVYRALNFRYAGWTDMDRKTPRYDYIAPGKHTRDAFRTGYTERVRRKAKVKYWTITGPTRSDRKKMERMCGWPSMSWADAPTPYERGLDLV